GLDPEGREQMLDLIKRLGQFDINVIVSSHVLPDIERTCDWVVMLDAGNLLRSAPLKGFEKDSTVLAEVLERPEELAAMIRQRGIEAVVDGLRVVVGPGEGLEDAIVGAAARLGTGLVRMTRGSASLEELFLVNGGKACPKASSTTAGTAPTKAPAVGPRARGAPSTRKV